jgi:hypothetical protein
MRPLSSLSRALNGLKIHTAGVAPFGKDTPEQRSYFPRDLLMDRSSRFFSSAVQPSWT